MVMLLLVEFVNVSSSGKLMERLKSKPVIQILLATLLGLIPGCIGGFAIVSLYTHKLISFGALVAGMISGFGDEAFVLFAMSPRWTLILSGCLFVIGAVAGLATYYLFRKREFRKGGHHLELHHDCEHHDNHSDKSLSYKNLKNISFPRAVLLFGLIIYLFVLISGTISHQHAVFPAMDFQQKASDTSTQHQQKGIYFTFETTNETPAYTHDHGHDCDHDHSHNPGETSAHGHDHGIFSWENLIFILLALTTLAIVALSSEHFLVSHLWEHVIKQHFLTVLLWTFGVLLFVQCFMHFVDINAFLAENQWGLLLILAIALLVGIIPESGPHLIFVIMFFSGTIPFSILLANSIVQDGHGALPLLAESRKDFLLMKSINLAVGLVVGLLGYYVGF